MFNKLPFKNINWMSKILLLKIRKQEFLLESRYIRAGVQCAVTESGIVSISKSCNFINLNVRIIYTNYMKAHSEIKLVE